MSPPSGTLAYLPPTALSVVLALTTSLATAATVVYVLLTAPIADKLFLRKRVHPRERDFGHLHGDALASNPHLDAIPAWPKARTTTLNSENPVTEHFALLKWHTALDTPILRTGPNQVHVADPASQKTIFAQGTNYAKGRLYDLFDDAGIKNVFSMRFKDEHAPRRKLLSHAFAPNSVRTVRPFIAYKVTKLMARLRDAASTGSPIDMFTAFQTLSGDITLKFAFAYDAQMVEAGRLDQLLFDIRQRTKAQAPSRRAYRALETFPFLRPVARFLPEQVQGDVAAMQRLDLRLRKIIKDFIARGGDESEVFHKIVSAIDDQTGTPLDPEVLMVESRGMVIAGVETTAGALTYLTWHLAKEPELYDRLLTELRSIAPEKWNGNDDAALDIPDAGEIAQLPFLSALVKEVFRMYPAGARPLPRVVPAGGGHFHGHYLPAGTEITCGQWVQHRWQPGLWGSEPLKFRPDRWLPDEAEPERLVNMNRSLIHFSSGPRTCIGKGLALDVLYMTVAALFANFRPSRSTDPDKPGLITRDEDMMFLGFLVAFPKGHRLDMRWEKSQ